MRKLWTTLARLVKGAGVVKMSQNGLFCIKGANLGIAVRRMLVEKHLPAGRRRPRFSLGIINRCSHEVIHLSGVFGKRTARKAFGDCPSNQLTELIFGAPIIPIPDSGSVQPQPRALARKPVFGYSRTSPIGARYRDSAGFDNPQSRQ